jgi:hypothetical protein
MRSRDRKRACSKENDMIVATKPRELSSFGFSALQVETPAFDLGQLDDRIPRHSLGHRSIAAAGRFTAAIEDPQGWQIYEACS